MKDLKSLLEKISRTLNRGELIKEDFIQIIKEESGVLVSKESLQYKEGVLTITASPVVKNQIALKEEGIRMRLKNVRKISYR